jgi:hypothetical protein
MMGRRESAQGQFFYSFDLDKVVPPDDLVILARGVLHYGSISLGPFRADD